MVAAHHVARLERFLRVMSWPGNWLHALEPSGDGAALLLPLCDQEGGRVWLFYLCYTPGACRRASCPPPHTESTTLVQWSLPVFPVSNRLTVQCGGDRSRVKPNQTLNQ